MYSPSHRPATDRSTIAQPAAATHISQLPPSRSRGAQHSPDQKSVGPVIRQVEGNLLEQNVDAIVNAWNRNLIPYWLLVTQGVSGAIKRVGGVQPFVELRSFGVLPLGAARLTGPGTLPLRGIIHVAGINHAWRSTEQSVRDSVKNALVIAKNEGFRSVAFPAIGAGSSIALGNRQIALWGISEQRSLEIVAEEASRSDYPGEVVVVKFRK